MKNVEYLSDHFFQGVFKLVTYVPVTIRLVIIFLGVNFF